MNQQQVTAELFYADVRLPKVLEIADRAGKTSYQVAIPQNLQGSIYPQKGQHLTLKRL